MQSSQRVCGHASAHRHRCSLRPFSKRLLFWSVGLTVGVSRLATAQRDTVSSVEPSAFVMGSADSSADTGRMVAAHTQWTSYTNVGQCIEAMVMLQRRLVMSGDTTPTPPKKDLGTYREERVPLRTEGRILELESPLQKMSPISLAAGRTCMKQFRVADASASTLPDYLLLALLFHDDTLATAVVRQQRALATTPLAQREILARAFAATLATSPPPVNLAMGFLRQLDSLPDAVIERFEARRALMRSAATVPAVSVAHRDTAIMLGMQIPPTAFDENDIGSTLLYLYKEYLKELRDRIAKNASDTSALQRYRTVRKHYLAVSADLQAVGAFTNRGSGSDHPEEFKDPPPPL